jgi:hypothetical protein
MNHTMSKRAVVVIVLAVAALALVAALAYVAGNSDDGAAGALSVREVLVPDTGEENTADGVTIKIAQARCDEGEIVTGGGFRISGESRAIELQVRIKESLASLGDIDDVVPNVWTAVAHAPEGIGVWGLDPRAMCATTSG